ncbi:MAG: COX15/CtaA family protein [Gammaproteobacteria bacterium]|nr:COX15/CtaA family protein [Gammaproteobacteria bacterium]
MVKSRLVSRLALFGSFFALCVIALGAFTRLIDAGLGCPDWPGCYGHLTVPLSHGAELAANLKYPTTHLVAYKAWAEMIHRYFVGVLSFLILSIVSLIFAQKSARSRSNLIFAVSLMVLLCYQIMLGQWTVTLKLLPVIVSQHLLGGFLIVSLLWMLYLNNKHNEPMDLILVNRCRQLLPWAVIALLLVLFQISLGAWTSTNYASLSCPDFPLCVNGQSLIFYWKAAFNLISPVGINYEGGVLPTAIRQTIQMTHRFGALILTTYLLVFLSIAFHQVKRSLRLMQTLYLIIGLLCIQIGIGISNVIFKLPLATAIAHNLVAALLLLAVITLVFQLATTHHKAST